MSQRSCLGIVLAAGKGQRFLSHQPKVMHALAGQPMVGYVMDAAVSAGASKIAFVHGPEMSDLVSYANETGNKIIGKRNISFFEQRDRLGTAHAVLAARSAWKKGIDDILILFGDTPLIRSETLINIRKELAGGAHVVVLGFHASNPRHYGRLIRDKDQNLIEIREYRDASQSEREITFCNSGIMALSGAHALSLLESVDSDNAQSEFYLSDLPLLAHQKQLRIAVVECSEEDGTGINNRAELAYVESLMQNRLRNEALAKGVTMIAPETVFLSYDTLLESDVLIEPYVVLGPGVSVARGTIIRSFCEITGGKIAENVNIGPFSHLRPGVTLDQDATIGNFVELKDAKIASGVQIKHLSYVGNATVGDGVNIGAGVITCNYDGVHKHCTEISAGAFIGSNSSLVAPLKIGTNAYIGAGSVITMPIEANTLAFRRSPLITRKKKSADFHKADQRKTRKNCEAKKH
ncbi:MAG: bifunctional UDP-N-acetylglucosamine diphosphorylase/glucosamine-1-phosphate N-acetyltransferase GlmU [Alphaproteobacteria bacterium]|nr:bifunctional UDP-N-acetylglucosamine diphosphorylase/glucosamine-1-phosphate N-acetyltransferase GlmU [Alphaproteobacteria bacterium]